MLRPAGEVRRLSRVAATIVELGSLIETLDVAPVVRAERDRPPDQLRALVLDLLFVAVRPVVATLEPRLLLNEEPALGERLVTVRTARVGEQGPQRPAEVKAR